MKLFNFTKISPAIKAINNWFRCGDCVDIKNQVELLTQQEQLKLVKRRLFLPLLAECGTVETRLTMAYIGLEIDKLIHDQNDKVKSAALYHLKH